MSQDGAPNLPAPQPKEANPPESRAASGSDRSDGRAAGRVLTEQECLVGLSQLPSLIALGLLKGTQANAMRGPFNDLLRYHQQAGRTGSAGAVADENLLEILRRNPELLQYLEPILTPEHVEMIMREATKDDE